MAKEIFYLMLFSDSVIAGEPDSHLLEMADFGKYDLFAQLEVGNALQEQASGIRPHVWP
jgi:hypothetical protein